MTDPETEWQVKDSNEKGLCTVCDAPLQVDQQPETDYYCVVEYHYYFSLCIICLLLLFFCCLPWGCFLRGQMTVGPQSVLERHRACLHYY